MDIEAKQRFYMDHIYIRQRDIYSITRSIFGDPSIAEEMTQNILERAWIGLDTLRDYAKTDAWINGIMRNEIRGRMRTRKILLSEETSQMAHEYIVKLQLLQSDKDSLDLIVKKEEKEQIFRLLEMMDIKYRLVIKLHVVAEFSLKEIAEMREIKYSTVRSMYRRGIRKLRELYLASKGGGK